MELNVWLKDKAIVYLGGDPSKGEQPLVTTTVTKPQILIDPKNNTIIIKETK